MSFITLAESKVATKGSIVVTVTNIGELKAGSSAARDWTRKDITVQDGSGSETMSVWGDDIKRFALNHKYELVGIYWKENKGKQYLNFGQYSQIRDCGVSAEPGQNTMESSTATETVPSSEEFLKQKQEQVKKEQEELEANFNPLQSERLEFVESRGMLLYKIKKALENKIKSVEPDPHPGMIWEMTNLVYQDYKVKYLK